MVTQKSWERYLKRAGPKLRLKASRIRKGTFSREWYTVAEFDGVDYEGLAAHVRSIGAAYDDFGKRDVYRAYLATRWLSLRELVEMGVITKR